MLKDLPLSEARILRHGRALVEAVQAMPGGAPLYADLGSLDRWQGFVDETLAKISPLMEAGTFHVIRPETVARLSRWAASGLVRAAFEGKIALAHADLSGGNVFLTPGGYKIIDWQFPRRLPDGFDLSVYLDFMGLDPIVTSTRLWSSPVRPRGLVRPQPGELFPMGDRYEAFVVEFVERILAHEGSAVLSKTKRCRLLRRRGTTPLCLRTPSTG